MRRILALALALAATGCASNKVVPRWIDGQVPASSEQVLWEVVLMALEREGYPVGTGADPAKRTVESNWREVLQPFKGQGFRERATVRLEPLSDDTFGVRIRVERETNESLRPTDPVHAEWKPAPDHEEAARRLLQYLRSFMGGGSFEVGAPKPRTGQGREPR